MKNKQMVDRLVQGVGQVVGYIVVDRMIDFMNDAEKRDKAKQAVVGVKDKLFKRKARA